MPTSTEIEEKAVDSPVPWVREHIEQYLASDGADVDFQMRENLILLYTRGRKTGQIRRVAVVHYPDGDDLVVIASKGGAPEHPAWYLNLRDDPRVWVRQKSEFFPAVASDLEGEEYQTMWKRITDWNPSFQEYQDNTERRLPMVRLRRVEEHD